MPAPARRGIRRRPPAHGGLAAGQAALHRPAGGPLPARAGRDLLQLGHHQDPAPHAFPERFHLRAAGRQHRIHRERRPRRTPHLPRLLPGGRGPAGHAAAHRGRLPARLRLRGPAARRGPRGGRHAAPHRAHEAARQLPDPGAVQPVLPQQGRLSGRQAHQRLHRDPARAAPAARALGRRAGDRRRALRRGRPARALQLRAPTSSWTWRSPAPTCAFCAA